MNLEELVALGKVSDQPAYSFCLPGTISYSTDTIASFKKAIRVPLLFLIALPTCDAKEYPTIWTCHGSR